MINSMSHKKKISVIINNYNYASFIAAAIESALNQSYQNIEILVVDDGSTDESRKIILSYGDKIKALFKSNGGQASAFNLGLSNATGEIIIFLDSDDVLLPNCLEEVSQSFEVDEGIVCTRWYLEHIDQDGHKLNSTNPPQGVVVPTGDLSEQILHNGWRFVTPPTSGNAFLKSCLDDFFPIPMGLVRSADVYLFANTAVRGKLGFIPEILGCYRHNMENKHHFLLSRPKVISELLAADLTDRSIDQFFVAKLVSNGSFRAPWANAGDEMLRRILFKYTKQQIFSPDLYQPMPFKTFLVSHSLLKSIKFLIGAVIVAVIPIERLTFRIAGVLIGKHTILGRKKLT
jgi:glycosyltransferase involved in cell wall biosynthesis